ncbi:MULTISPECIES: ABC transporter ATP-binding protein [unclassified Achromobacter]|uniref:ABC transporter ATP-binding protein n=1 Tax=unclassified Achromobacter TaxID=2626865 RepID=UPI000B51922D|nr:MULTISPECIES: oligopeptide/dipeptide ABC transporter ATP-binding protein [unclassified Achromobacter]OWT76883.1 peptide ABC transporter ATP-binding protein [Achromobacter sp. HZ28]OWT77763.1 peptide ABC transporter ATP-binding protein [Achromobacter sp. HZ34]
MSHDAQTPMVEVDAVSRRFGRRQDWIERVATRIGLAKQPPVVRAVDNVSITVRKGEVVGLVGESGCGKSTLGRMVAGLLAPSSGEVRIDGQALGMKSAARAQDRRAHLRTQMIFQNPFASLNPRLTVGEIIMEAPMAHKLVTGNPADYLALQMERAGLNPAYRDRLPHQFSGGQRQRIGIARALAVQPELLVCDESVAALDVSIQAQILNLFMSLRDQLGLTYLFISHDLGVVKHISDRVVIMYLGRVVEEAATETIFQRPSHPYTQALLAEVPRIDLEQRAFDTIQGELPSPLSPPSGCHFHPRCPRAIERCRSESPEIRMIGPGHRAACHLAQSTT